MNGQHTFDDLGGDVGTAVAVESSIPVTGRSEQITQLLTGLQLVLLHHTKKLTTLTTSQPASETHGTQV